MSEHARQVSYRGVAHPWLCDRNAHLNTRHYVGAFDDAAQHFFADLESSSATHFSWADVSQQISYAAEVPLGELFYVECRVTRVGRTSLGYRQTLRLQSTGEISAVVDAVTVRFDLDARRAVPLSAEFVRAARADLEGDSQEISAAGASESSG